MAANDARDIDANLAAEGITGQADSSPLPFEQAAAQGMMPPPPGRGQNGQVPPAQDGLPQEAMARATYNELLGMYTPHSNWHSVEGFGKSPLLLASFTFGCVALWLSTFTDYTTS